MNHIYRVVFNSHTNTFQAVAETAKGQHKTHSNKQRQSSSKRTNYQKLLLTPLTFCISLVSSTFAMANPTGGKVSAGQASISQNGNTTTIKQTSQNSAINWQKFSINNNETVNFKQPNFNSITLNRVLGNEKSVIKGALNANGKVFIQNPNGTLIGKNAQVNVGGLLATTASINDNDFMAGNYRFTGNDKGTIENLGNITVPKGGVVAFIAPVVKNAGKITAPQGKVLLASAENFTITLPNDTFSYTLDKGTIQGLVDNGGVILADGGRVVLTTKGVDSVKKSVLKHTGIIEANTVKNNNGVIELLGDLDNSELQLTGTIKAEGKGNAQGGFVETSASKLNIADSAVVSTKAENGKTGTWAIGSKGLTVATDGGEITGKQVVSALNNNNVTLKSTDGSADGVLIKGDVIVNDEISWDKNKLTLSADRDIQINKTMNGNNTAKLALEYGLYHTFGYQSDYYLDKNTPLKNKNVQINLAEGNNLSIKKGKDKDIVEYEVIHKMPSVRADGTTKDFSSDNIAVGKNIDLKGIGNSKFLGWTASKDMKNFNGLGHSITNLKIDYKNPNFDKTDLSKMGVSYWEDGNNKEMPIGLFRLARSIDFKDLVIKDAKVNVDVAKSKDDNDYKNYRFKIGALAGRSSRNSNNIYIKNGNVSVKNTIENKTGTDAGLLFGEGGGSNIHTTGNIDVKSLSNNLFVGGIAGDDGTIQNNLSSEATVSSSIINKGSYKNKDFTVTGTGGLFGSGGGSITYSKFTGKVKGDKNVGGLVGYRGTGNDIETSVSEGIVIGDENIGGLVGLSSGWWRNGSWGWGKELVAPTIRESSSFSTIKGNKNVGGILGKSALGTGLENVYSESKVKGNKNVGGLVGLTENYSNTIKNSYSNSIISNPNKINSIGGLVGNKKGDVLSINNSYYNQSKNPTITKDIGNNPEQDLSRTDKQMKQKSTFEKWNFDKVWRIDEGNDYPRLQALTEATLTIDPTKMSIKANNLSKTYDGKAVNTQADLEKLDGWNGTGVSTEGLLDNDKLTDKKIFTGKLRFDGKGSNWQGAKDAGNYTIVPTGLGSQKYDIKFGKGNLNIKPKNLTVIGESTYNGTTQVGSKGEDIRKFGGKIEGIVGDDVRELEVTGTGTLADKNVGTKKLVSHNLKIDDIFAKNYRIPLDNSKWKVNKAILTATGKSEYNGTDKIKAFDERNIDGIMSGVKTNRFGNDDIHIKGNGTLASKNVGTNHLIHHDFIITGKDSANYKLNPLVDWTITPKPVGIYAEYDDKFYDGTKKSSKKPSILIYGSNGSDSITAEQEFESADIKGVNQSVIKPINIVVKDGNDGKNYKIETRNAKGTIQNPKYKYLLAKDLPKNDKFQHLNNTNIVFEGYTREKLRTMTTGELIDLQRDLVEVLADDSKYKINRNFIKTRNKVDMLNRHKYAKLHGVDIPIPFLGDVPFGGMGGAFGKSDFEALFSKKGLSFTLRTVKNMVTVGVAIKTGGTLDMDIEYPQNKLGKALEVFKLLKVDNYKTLDRLFNLAIDGVDKNIVAGAHDVIFGGVDIYKLAPNEVAGVLEIVTKMITQSVETGIAGEVDNLFTAKMIGLYIDLGAEFLPEGALKASAKVATAYIDQYDNAEQLAKYSTELFYKMSKPVSEYYKAEIDKVSKEQFVENIMILQKANQDSFRLKKF